MSDRINRWDATTPPRPQEASESILTHLRAVCVEGGEAIMADEVIWEQMDTDAVRRVQRDFDPVPLRISQAARLLNLIPDLYSIGNDETKKAIERELNDAK